MLHKKLFATTVSKYVTHPDFEPVRIMHCFRSSASRTFLTMSIKHRNREHLTYETCLSCTNKLAYAIAVVPISLHSKNSPG